MNATARRAKHIKFKNALRDRKRARKLRGEIHAVMLSARDMVGTGPQDGPFRAPDIRTDVGWQVLNVYEQPVAFATSRDKARAKAKELNDTPAMTYDQALAQLGWRHVKDSGPLEERYERIES